MAFEPGGRADKLGNRYEGRWVAEQLLRLINEEILSVTIESVGDDEIGVDLWIGLKDGRRQAQQCKARNRSKEFWPVYDLKARGVLDHLRLQLDQGPNVEFAFVSAIPATGLGDICDSARNSPGPEAFFEHQVRSHGYDRRKVVEGFCDALGLDQQTAQGRDRAYGYLRRSYTELYPYDDSRWRRLLAWTGYLLTGQPEVVVAFLCQYAESNDQLGKAIHADELREHLRSLGIYPKNLAHDQRVSPAVQRLQERFRASICPLLIGGSVIPRDETDKCIEAMAKEPVVVVHGAAGSGKSGVLYELTCRLQQQKIPVLPLRLDRSIPKGNAGQFGEDVGLPDSPVHCLAALAGDRPSVLVLDQLDAIRWTSSHSADAVDVCRELIEQVSALRREGKDIRAVLVCRTFDLEHDPQIRHWLADRACRVEVGPLPQQSVRAICGADYHAMTEKQRRILANPQNLSMWFEMRRERALPPFHSATELMRRFWAFRRRQMEKEGISAVALGTLLCALRDWMDARSVSSAPERIAEQFSREALDALRSHGILQVQDGSVNFTHQSYLDFLIAEKVLAAIDEGGTILDWLGPKERQTLFRRQQLRQALVLLEEESRARFRESAQSILTADNVRFHLKHLVLEVIGQVQDVDDALADYCIGLLSDRYWHAHMLDTVFLAHAQYVRLLAQRGVIGQWLESAEQERMDRALRLLGSVVDKLPDLVAELLAPFAENSEEWARRILHTIGRNAAADSDAMFEFRLGLARRGFVHDIVDWPTLCRKHPRRALRLVDAYLPMWVVSRDHTSQPGHKRHLDSPTAQDVAAMREVGRECPCETWDVLMPHVSRLSRSGQPLAVSIGGEWHQSAGYGLDVGEVHLPRALADMLVAAGQALAQADAALLLKKAKAYEESDSRLVQQILMDVYCYLPPTYADAGVQWLLRDVRRLRLGDGETEPVWMPAVRIVRALSAHCTTDVFERLEHTLIEYRDPEERKLAKHRLESCRFGHFTPYWGREQHFLLPALCPERRGQLTNDLIALLAKRYEGWQETDFLEVGISGGGWVGSKLDQHLERISDKAWLGIVANREIPRRRGGNWVQVDEDHIVESSVSQFSRSLATVVNRFPERFGRLALRFPLDTHPAYVSAILEAMSLTQPDPAAQSEKGEDWEPVSPGTIMAFLERFRDLSERETAIAFCRLVRSRPEDEWPPSSIARLVSYAQEHPDPEPGELVVHSDKSSDEATVDVLFQNTINCVRGVAAGAIGQLLWHHPDWLDALQAGITSVVNDPHPAVRMAAIEALLAVLNINREQAVNWFCDACRQDARISASPHAIRFLNYTVRQHPEHLGAVVRAMVCSAHPDVAHQGAQAIMASWLFYDLFEKELMGMVGRWRVIRVTRLAAQQGLLGRIFARCLLAIPMGMRLRGSAPQRAGVARIAASFVSQDKYAARCREFLKPCFDDPANDVRDATSLMWRDELLRSAENAALAEAYVQSKAFAEHPSWALRYLEEHEGSLVPLSKVIFRTCEALRTVAVQTGRGSRTLWYETRAVPLLLLRLYEQSQERRSDIACRCLDAWDLLLEKRVGFARELTRAIDR